MSGTYDTVTRVLSAAVADGGTFTLDYPAGRDSGDYAGGFAHEVATNAYDTLRVTEGKVSFSFGASSITVTNTSGATLAAGTSMTAQLDRTGADKAGLALADSGTMAELSVIRVNLGAPKAASANAICASQSVAANVDAVLASSALDVPRNIVMAWTGAAVPTVEGVDKYGKKVVESGASGTSFTGKKAFAKVTRIRFSAAVTGMTAGFGDVLGLPVFVPAGALLRELQDSAIATAGTLVAGVAAKATATTGDVRGTYDPNAACNDALAFLLDFLLGATDNRGVAQFAG